MTARGFEHVDHTADLGIRAWGPDLGVAFAEAARGLFAYMVDVEATPAVGDVRVTLEADSAERLLFAFLDDLLYRHQTGLLVFTRFDVRVEEADGAWMLEAHLAGEALDAARHGHVHEIKAMTYHEMRVEPGPPAEVFVLVDI